MTGDEADDLISLAVEVEQCALGHEKLIQRLDLGRARSLRLLARRIRAVVDRGESGLESPDLIHREVIGLRLEAMVALLSQPEVAPPITSKKAAGAGPGADVIPICRIRRRD